MENAQGRSLGRGWLWLAVPLAVSSIGWITVPFVVRSNETGLEGALFYAAAAGFLSTVATAPVTIIVLTAIGMMSALRFSGYIAIIFATALPVLVFESIGVSTSAMPAFIGNWSLNLPDPYVQPVLAAAFIAIYALLAVVTYPFARRGGMSASVAAVASGSAILVAFIIRLSHLS